MSLTPPSGPEKRRGPIPWWMPDEPSAERIAVLGAVCLSVVLGVAAGAFAMHRLYRWLRRQGNGESEVQKDTIARDIKRGDSPLNCNLRKDGATWVLCSSQPPSTPAAAGNTTRSGFKNGCPYSIAAGAGVLPVDGSSINSSGTVTTASSRIRSSGVNSPPPSTTPRTSQPMLRECSLLERESSQSSRHDSSRSFPAGDFGPGVDSTGKGAVSSLDAHALYIRDAKKDCVAVMDNRSDGGDGFGMKCCSNIRSTPAGTEPVPKRRPGPETSVPKADAIAELDAIVNAAVVAADAPSMALELLRSGDGAAATTKVGKEIPPAPGPSPTLVQLGPRAPVAAVPVGPSAPPTPPSLTAQPSGGGMFATRALFESYHEREIEQRLRKVVFGSFHQRGTTSPPTLPPQPVTCNSCGGMDPAARQQPQRGISSVGGTLSLELTLRWSPAETPALVPPSGCGNHSADPSVCSVVRTDCPIHGGPAAQESVVNEVAYPRNIQHGSSEGGVTTISARDLLLGNKPSSLHYCYSSCQHLIQLQSRATSGLTGALPQSAVPFVTAAVSVPTPQAPLVKGSAWQTACKEPARIPVPVPAPSTLPSEPQDVLLTGATLAAWSAMADLQQTPSVPDLGEAPLSVTEGIDGSGPRSSSDTVTASASMVVQEDVPVATIQTPTSSRPMAVLPSDYEPSPPSALPLSLRCAEDEDMAAFDRGGNATMSACASKITMGADAAASAADGVGLFCPGEAVSSTPATAVPARSGQSCMGSEGSSRARSSGGGHGGVPLPRTVAAVLACLAGEDLVQEVPSAEQQQQHCRRESLMGQLSPSAPQVSAPGQQQQDDLSMQSVLAALHLLQLQPPGPQLPLKAQQPRQQQMESASRGMPESLAEHTKSKLGSYPWQSGSILGSEDLQPPPPLQQRQQQQQQQESIGARGDLETGNDEEATYSSTEVGLEGHGGKEGVVASAADFAEGRTERLWGLRRSNSSFSNRGISCRKIRCTGLTAAIANAAAITAVPVQGSSAALLMEEWEGGEGGLSLKGVAQVKSMPWASAVDEVAGGKSVVEGASLRETQVGSPDPLQLALMAPRIWPASGAAGLQGPLAKCVAERLMTRNPLFRRVQDCITLEDHDSGSEDD